MRYEYKYYIPYSSLPKLREMIRPFVEVDKYAQGLEENTYTVRSIYYDTPHLIYYKEKVEGLRNRKKVRIRGYNTESSEATVFLEIKRKYEIPMMKNRTPLTFQEAKNLINGQIGVEDFPIDEAKYPVARDDARKFLFQFYRRNLKPVVLVIYEREPYLSKSDPTIRITFDKHLRSSAFPELKGLYQENCIQHSLEDQFILEVKFNDYYPAWMKSIISVLGVRQESASKYVISMDAHQISEYAPERILKTLKR